MRELDIEHDKLFRYAGRSWLEIDIDQLGINIEAVKENLNDNVKFYAVVKANAYGYGAVEIAREMSKHGVLGFAVATLDEAIDLREHDIKESILMLSFSELERADLAANYNLSFTIPSLDFAKALDNIYKNIGKVAKVHIAVDTGMGRIGFQADLEESRTEILSILEMENLEIEGIYTHFSTASGSDYSEGKDSENNARKFFYQQLATFNSLLADLKSAGLEIPIVHAANSASILSYPESQFDAVRVGIIAYGIYPSRNLFLERENKAVKPVISWKSRVHQVKNIKAGGSIGYDRRFVTKHDMKIAVIPVGYADGFSRSMFEKAQVLYNGVRCNVVGAVCMDMLMIDCGPLNFEPKIGDVIELIDPNVGFEYVDVYDQATWRDTIPYEIGTSISLRIPRVYKKNERIYRIVWY